MSEENWVELCEVPTQTDVELIQSLLDGQGIPVIFRSFLPTTVYPGLAPIKIFVSKKDLEAAREILAASDSDNEMC